VARPFGSGREGCESNLLLLDFRPQGAIGISLLVVLSANCDCHVVVADCQLVYKGVPPNPRCKATSVDISLRTLAVLDC